MAKGRSSKNSVKVGLIDGNSISEKEIPNVELLNEMVKEGSKVEKPVSPAMLISTVDFPLNINYGDAVIRLTGRARERVADRSKLGEVPMGITVKKL